MLGFFFHGCEHRKVREKEYYQKSSSLEQGVKGSPSVTVEHLSEQNFLW